MNIGILLAAGTSTRFGKGDKLFASLSGKPVISHSLGFLQNSSRISEIWIAVNRQNRKRIAQLVKDENFNKVKRIALGGHTRFQSLRRVLRVTHSNVRATRYFIIHNAANPSATYEELQRCIKALRRKNLSGVAVGRRVTSTLKKITTDGTVEKTVERSSLWETETPQAVHARDFLTAIKKFSRQKNDYTDDLAVLEAAGKKTAVVAASPRNRKITTREDVPFILVGIGEDSHRFQSKSTREKLKLGGTTIPHVPALEAESDGDVMIHALCNAINSALGLGSMGTFATSLREKGIRDSRQYLKKILTTMKRQHRALQQCAFSFEAKRPMIDPLTPLLKKNLSALLRIPPEHIGITATSGEGLTSFGRGEGIKCQAIIVLSTI